MVYVLFTIGFALLIKGADWLVDGSSALARRFGVPDIIVGLTVVAFGTSLPELIVNLFSALQGNTDIALGNIIGSNISNILLILGLTAAIFPLTVKVSTTWKEIPFSLVALCVLFIMSNDVLIDKNRESILTAGDGILLLFFFGFFLYHVIKIATEHHETDEKEKKGRLEKLKEVEKKDVKQTIGITPKTEKGTDDGQYSKWKIGGLIAIGCVGLYFGGEWVVNGAIRIAKIFKLSDFLISATIIAIGTSLPELVTSIIAAVKKQPDLSVGNVIGSNIFNVLLVLGVTSIVTPIPVTLGINNDLIFTMVVTVYLFLFLFVGKKYKLERWQGILFFILYIGYIVYVVLRG